MASRKSVANKSESKSGYNYQKEVKQLKKEVRLKEEKISLLSKDVKYKQDTIDLLTIGMKNKDEQLLLKDKELLLNDQSLKLLSDKIEVLEKHNDELKTDADKQSKLANMAQKKLNIAEQNNMNLLTQINSLAQNLNNLKNVNMALSSQLTMTMSAQQQYSPNLNINNNNTHQRISPDDNLDIAIDIDDNNSDSADDKDENSHDEHDVKSGSDDNDNTYKHELPDVKRTKPAKKRSSMIPLRNINSMLSQSTTNVTTKIGTGRKRSKSGGNQAMWDDNDNDKDKTEKEKIKRRKNKDKPAPQTGKNKRTVSNAKKLKRSHTIDREMDENDHWDSDKKEKHVASGDNDFFGNAPVGKVEKSKKKKKKTRGTHGGFDDHGTNICFDTYLSELDSSKLKITKNGRLVAMDYFTDSLYIISSNGYNSGKHEWEIKTLKTGDLTDEIGICSSWTDLEVNGNGISDMGSSQLGARAVYANDPSTGVAFHDAYDAHNKLTYDKKFKKKGNNSSEFAWSKGDIVKVAMNLNKWYVKFYLNNKQVGKSIPLTKDLTYYPILCAYGSCSYQVISCS